MTSSKYGSQGMTSSKYGKLLLSCDASPYGIGAVISCVMDDGSEKLIAYTLRSLSAERHYVQIDKEGLVIVY